MDVIIPQERTEELETLAKAEALREVEPVVADLMDTHKKKRRLWFPSDFLPADEQDEEDPAVTAQLRERARGLSDALRVAVALNLLTEEGLPHFHRLLAAYLSPDSVWQEWNFMWTAEEDRHGLIIHDYTRDARLFKSKHIEMMQYAYQEAGFTPSWDRDPYRVFVYTTLQERATQISHSNTGKLAGESEPLLKRILMSVAADEAKHFNFYRQVFASILEVDPNRAMQSALAIMPSIDMPGISMPNFKEMADVVRRSGIYGPWDYKAIVEEAIEFWKIDVVEGLNEAGRKAQDKIMQIPKRLEKVAQYIEQRNQRKSFTFDFIYGREFAMD